MTTSKDSRQPDLPQRKPLSGDEVRQLLRECVTVVKPGETLVLRLGPDYTPRDMREISEAVRAWAGQDGWPRVMVLPGDGLGVVAHEHEWTRCPNCPNPDQPCACSGVACCDQERREIAESAP